MCETGDGFKIAEKDLELRGPGEIQGTRQSGVLNFRLANVLEDRGLLEIAREWALSIAEEDASLDTPSNQGIRNWLALDRRLTPWSKIS